MKRPGIRLRNTDNSHCRFITPHEAKRLVDSGEARRLYTRKGRPQEFKLLPPIPPSESDETTAAVTASDMRAYAGLEGEFARYLVEKKVEAYRQGRHPTGE